jgi:hypothetical protein
MTADELDAWIDFYRFEPFDDFHRFHRPAALIAHVGGRNQIEDLLKWLRPEPKPVGFSDADLSVLSAFGLKPPRVGTENTEGT